MLQRQRYLSSNDDTPSEESLTLTTSSTSNNASISSPSFHLIKTSLGFRSHRRYLLLFILAAVSIFYMKSIPALLIIKSAHSSSHPSKLYGHLHIAKSGGTTLNGIVANKFDHVCGHKGYSYDAYNDNEIARSVVEKSGSMTLGGSTKWSRGRVDPELMDRIGYENCDYISHETPVEFWKERFGNKKFHGIPMELHVPCRNRIEHLMSMCNYKEDYPSGRPKITKKKIACDAQTDEELFDSVTECLLYVDRYDHELLEQFDVKCFNFQTQFTKYIDYLSKILSHRRFESTPYIKRETNDPRNKEEECIWHNKEVMEKVDKFLLDTVPYFQFCDRCIGSKDEIAA